MGPRQGASSGGAAPAAGGRRARRAPPPAVTVVAVAEARRSTPRRARARRRRRRSPSRKGTTPARAKASNGIVVDVVNGRAAAARRKGPAGRRAPAACKTGVACPATFKQCPQFEQRAPRAPKSHPDVSAGRLRCHKCGVSRHWIKDCPQAAARAALRRRRRCGARRSARNRGARLRENFPWPSTAHGVVVEPSPSPSRRRRAIVSRRARRTTFGSSRFSSPH